jgi:serine-type D-Ala-D-Ala carboxypeptidase (penicillin-binding protein 5/6)
MLPNGPRRLLSVVLGTASRECAGCREPEAAELGLDGLGRGAPVRRRPAGGHGAGVEGRQFAGRLGAAGAVVVTVPKGEGGKLQTAVERIDPLVAPLQQGPARRHAEGHAPPAAPAWPSFRWW